mmetsp:Transcript_25956/g.47444  ORF Transcript_25956/g.47444 Transcript_25956/m.47444 type:complete len:106 (+) Transcript_25956:389-706(+)
MSDFNGGHETGSAVLVTVVSLEWLLELASVDVLLRSVDCGSDVLVEDVLPTDCFASASFVVAVCVVAAAVALVEAVTVVDVVSASVPDSVVWESKDPSKLMIFSP